MSETQGQLELAVAIPTSSDRVLVRKRDGRAEPFNEGRIQIALESAYRAELELARDAELPADRRAAITYLASAVVERALTLAADGQELEVELIQDLVENELMRTGEHTIARRYIVYREERKKARLLRGAAEAATLHAPEMNVTLPDGTTEPLDPQFIRRKLIRACEGMDDRCDWRELAEEALQNLYDGVHLAEIDKAMIFAAKARVEREPAYSFVAARLLLNIIYREVLPPASEQDNLDAASLAARHRKHFPAYLQHGVDLGRVDSSLLTFNLEKISAALVITRDTAFNYMGLQTVYDRYLIHSAGRRMESPQYFWMRVAMGLAINEGEQKNERAIEFYELLSSLRFVSSTPTLFNSGTLHPQLSSCYLSTVMDDLDHIFKVISDDAKLSKWAGGLGNDWTNVRSTGALIRGTNGESQGVVPFLKVANDTAVAVNQGGKRKGAMCAYLETWHLDIEDFLELRKNTGDERRRTHDMNTANWIPDLFMKRVIQEQPWTLFNPSDAPDLHDLYGRAFEERYVEYEAMADRGELPLHRRIEAVTLWRKMLTMLFETGHPWLTFKDPSNICSPQDHVGVVHSSNLCCMTADQRVVTAEGILTVEELYLRATPNTVVGRCGPVSAGPMLLPRPDAPIVRIVTNEGYTHKVTPDHKVWVVDRGWVEAQHLGKGDRLEIQQLEGLWGQNSQPDEAFICGLVAGDGTFGRNEKTRQVHVDLWSNEFGLIDETEERVARILANQRYGLTYATTSHAKPCFQGDEYKRRLTSTPLARVLLELGFRAETKFSVPEFVWRGDRATVSQYLRALYLADATVQAQEIGLTTCSLASHRCEFLQEIQILLANFGIKSSLSKMREGGPAMLPDGEGGEKEYMQGALWRLLVTSIQGCQIMEEITGLGAARRNGQYLSNLRKTGYVQKRWATFAGLEILPNEDAYCLQVFTDEHSWTVNGLITKNTEILLNTSVDEIAVCNLGSINLSAHLKEGGVDAEKLESTVRTAMRMLDNVIDINYYPTPEARNANLRHRPVGLGLMGFQDALYQLNLPYGSDAAVEFADRSMETISYYAITASTELARERGTYKTYPGSKWDRGILPMDTAALLHAERGGMVEVDRSSTLDWDTVRAAVARHGMRNSNTMAIAPTATISNIIGVGQSIEPSYKHLFAKSNLSGEFTTINVHLVEALKALDLWDAEMLDDLKYYDGVLTEIERIPADVKDVFRTAFEIEPKWLIECASRRQKWIDMGQSLNLYLAGPSGKKLNDMYLLAWRKGLKTTYYLRTLAATQIEKSTVDINRRGAHPRWMKNKSASSEVQRETPAVVAEQRVEPATLVTSCSILDPTCEACQ